MARLDKDLKAIATFQYGKDAGPPGRVHQTVVAAAKDPKRREAVEQRLLRTLASATTRDAKAFLCRQLYIIGTARCVPQLEAMLTDPELSHMARYVLGRMSDPAALAALHRALGKTSGKLQAGIVNTLASRRYQKALSDFVKLLRSSDSAVAEAAARALGRIGGADAAKALQTARARGSRRMRESLNHALLACADRLLAEGQKAEAARIYEAFHSPKQKKHFRIAGLRGLVAARGEQAVPLLVEAIKSSDRERQATAIGLATRLKGQEATKAFVGLLPSVSPEAQELLLRALGSRRDAAAAPAILAATKSQHEAVRVAALEALGSVGDASFVGLLARAAAAAGGREQQAARASLVRLRGADVNPVIIKAVGSGDPKVRVELIRALAGRGTTGAVGELLKSARGDDATVRREAIRALGALVGERQLRALINLAVKPKDPGDRSAIRDAVEAAFRRVSDKERQAAPVLAALAGAPTDAKPTLLRLLGRAATPKALEAIRAALKDPNAAVQDAAVRALADWPDATPAEELLTLVRTSANQTHKVLALRGYVRMAGLSKNPTAMYVRAMELTERAQDKKLVLGGLGTASSAEALKLVEQYLKDKQLRAEAATAVVQIAYRLRQSDAARAKAAVKNVLAVVKEPAIRQKAQEVINEMTKFEGHILQWVGAGPYQVKGKDARALFNIPFPPEQPGAKDVKWKRLTKGIGAWEINLDLAIANLDDVAGYVRTRVWSPGEQDARLELGSDDAIKVWLNGQRVHAKDTDRGLAPRQDLVKVKLREGWNDLMLKVIDHTGGWAFSCRIRKPDGSALEGLKVEAK